MKILQYGDTQLGYRQYGLDARYDDYIKVNDQVMDLGLDLKVDAVVHTGDIFEKDVRSSDLEIYVRDCVRKLASSGIKFMGIEGNHDFRGNDSTLRLCDIQPLDNTYINEKGVVFTGINFVRTSTDRSVLLQKLSQILPGTDVVVMHQTLAEVCSIAADFTAEEVAALLKPKGVRYVAFGHIHNNWMTTVDGIWMVYSGSTEMTDIDEPPEKYAFEVDIPKNRATEIKVTMHKLDTRPIMRRTIDSYEQSDALLEEMKIKHGLYVVSVNSRLSDRIPSIEYTARKYGLPARVDTFFKKDGEFAAKVVDRAKTVVSLQDVIHDKFKPGTDQALLTAAILDNPAGAVETFKQYLKTKGVA